MQFPLEVSFAFFCKSSLCIPPIRPIKFLLADKNWDRILFITMNFFIIVKYVTKTQRVLIPILTSLLATSIRAGLSKILSLTSHFHNKVRATRGLVPYPMMVLHGTCTKSEQFGIAIFAVIR